jgi:CRISPR-associated protein Cmx8
MPNGKASVKKKAKSQDPANVVVEYDLFDLPTAFHKAGLAGLVLIIESLKERQKLDEQSTSYELTPTTVRVTFTKPLLQSLMDDLYDAQVVEVKVKSKWQGASLKRSEETVEQKDGKDKKVKVFVYDQVQPKGAFFSNVFDGEKQIWLKLWRDMIWNIPRGRPTTRIPFNNRAEGKSSGEGEAAWADLLKVEKARTRNGFHTEKLSSALFPGAQAVNAEGIPFEGRAEQNLLLHFWPLVALLYVPQSVEKDGSTEFVGYTIAVPEVSDVPRFVADYPRLLHDLKPDVRGYRPAEAIIDVAAEGALAFLDHLACVTSHDVGTSILRISVKAVEYVHLHKPRGEHNIKTMAAGRVASDRKLIEQYHSFVAPQSEATRYRHPLFRRGLLLALFSDIQWHKPFGRILAAFDAGLFIRQPRKSVETDRKGPPQFANDVAKKLRHVTQLFSQTLERMKPMPDAERPTAPLAVIVNRVVRNYLLARASERAGVHLDAFESDDEKIDWKKVPPEFNEAKQKLALGLMLEFRSRKEQAFVDHFARTFFSVTQRVSETDRLELANALTDRERVDDLKTLTLLSLSANS